MSILQLLLVIFIFIVVIGIINENFFHIQSDIALILFSFVISLVLLVISKIVKIDAISGFIYDLGNFEFGKYLMEGVLCFMLFAGASKVNMRKFRQNVRAISLLALLPPCFLPFATDCFSMPFPGYSLLKWIF